MKKKPEVYTKYRQSNDKTRINP